MPTTIENESVPPARTETLTKCPLCTSSRLKNFAVSYDRWILIDQRQFVYSTCRDCGLVFQSLRPVEQDIVKFYPSDYGPYKPQRSNSEKQVGLFSQTINTAQRLLAPCGDVLSKGIRKLFPTNVTQAYKNNYERNSHEGTLLDFGCGSDKFLNQARKNGWNTTGVDFSETAVNQAKRSGHEAYLVSENMWDQLREESFDYVRLSHVLEHLYDPKDVLTRLWKTMKPGARMHIAIPNSASFTARVFRKFWMGLDCPRHIMLYSPTRITQLLSGIGFENLNILHETVTKDISRSIVYVLTSLGLVRHDAVHRVIHSKFLDAVLYLPMRICSALGHGDRIHVFCQKPMSDVTSLKSAA